jgi:hypothetical protein
MSQNRTAYKDKDGLAPEWIDEVDDTRLAQVLEAFTAWPSDLNDEMLTSPILAMADRTEPVCQGLALHGRIIGDRLILSTPPGVYVPEGVRDIEIRLTDVNIVVNLRSSTARCLARE